MNINEAIDFVSKEAKYHDHQSSKLLAVNDKDENGIFHFQQKQHYSALYNLLVEIEHRLNPSKSNSGILPSELEGLPKELIEQLSTDAQEMDILKIIEDHGGTISLDRLILSYYKMHKIVLERRKLTAKLYRMCKSDLLYTVGERGIYTLYEPEKKN